MREIIMGSSRHLTDDGPPGTEPLGYTVTMSEPSPAEDQLRILLHVQQILADGSFVSTYKFALLQAIADLCVEDGRALRESRRLATWRIAEGFIAQYWRHVDPFPGREDTRHLQQNTDRQIALLRHIEAYRQKGGQLRAGFADPAWIALRTRAERILIEMPLFRLQTIGRRERRLLYEPSSRGDYIDLLPGVAETLARFHGLVTGLIQERWVRWVRRLPANQSLLGDRVDLGEFLFGSERADLGVYRGLLMELQRAVCFYCGRRVREGGEIDHFVPWARYPRDLGHNFVLSCGPCNGAKSDLLAGPEHLERWLGRNAAHDAALRTYFNDRRLPHDLGASMQITRWAYGAEEEASGQLWLRGRETAPIDPGWRALLAA